MYLRYQENILFTIYMCSEEYIIVLKLLVVDAINITKVSPLSFSWFQKR